MNQSIFATLQSHFPENTTWDWECLQALLDAVKDWNEKVNVVSRKDIDFLVERHLAPSLSIAKVLPLAEGARVLDIGTGGGFPGLPLAVCFPKTHFTLVDSVGKKITVVRSIAEELKLNNVEARHMRAEDLKETFDFVVARAVTALPRFMSWVQGKFKKTSMHSIPNGVFYLKGGDMEEEFQALGVRPDNMYDLEQMFQGAFCESKQLLYFSAQTVAKVKIDRS